ncbi:hypothetical protein SAMN05660199_01615 [Klenkia soli]|uniref:CopC domain-containing protein n=1 Tax=Klenkia soli TaxID=1052260 RepID=A0A1H0HY47_9ACTN|nr:copper resistance CopC family protein [Klenkia soli]SDO24148.1 hypothetical protein SAMN05660199_01615 [Klenkia soli]
MPRTRPSTLLLTLLVAATAWLATAGTAQAHTGLTSTTPAEGSTVTEQLTAVTLTFSGAVRGPEVVVTGPDGAVVSTAAATGEGSTVTVPVTPTATGPHTVTWAVTSADGHDLTGTVGFDHAGPVVVPAVPEAPTSVTATSSSAAPPADVVVAQPGAAASEAPEDGGNLLVNGTAAVLVLAVVAGAVFLVRRRQAGASGSAGKSR